MLLFQRCAAFHKSVADELEKDKRQQKIPLVRHGGTPTQIVAARHEYIFQPLFLGSLGGSGFSGLSGGCGSSLFSSFSGHGFYPFL